MKPSIALDPVAVDLVSTFKGGHEVRRYRIVLNDSPGFSEMGIWLPLTVI